MLHTHAVWTLQKLPGHFQIYYDSGMSQYTYLCSDVLVTVLKHSWEGFHQQLHVHDLGTKLPTMNVIARILS